MDNVMKPGNRREEFRTIPDTYSCIPIDKLFGVTKYLLLHQGLSEQHSDRVARTLAYSDLRGNDTHGTSSLLPRYLKDYKLGKLNPKPTITFDKISPSITIVEADQASGTIALGIATDIAVKTAKDIGISFVGVNNAGHSAAIGYFAFQAAKEGVFCLSFAGGRGLMAPPRSKEAFLGTNPIAYSLPNTHMPPLVYDGSTTAICGNRVRLARKRGIKLLPEWIVSKNDHQFNADYNSEILPILAPIGHSEDLGSHKAFGLALLGEVLCNTLFGDPENYTFSDKTVGHCLIAISAFNTRSVADRTDTLLREICNLETMQDDLKMQYPGLQSYKTAKERFRQGVPIPPEIKTWLTTELNSINQNLDSFPIDTKLKLEDFV